MRRLAISLAILVAGCSSGGHGNGGDGGLFDLAGGGMLDLASGGQLDGGGGGGGGGGGDLSLGSDVIDKLLALTADCSAAKMVSTHVYTGGMDKNVAICALNGAVFFNADMDIDCDGRMTPGKCPGPDPSYQPDTAFHNLQDQPLEAAVTPYVVIPYDFAYPGLDTANGGNVVAVIYNHQLEFAVFGDTGPTDIIGEASYACAENLGIDPNPATGGVGSGVTYVVFVGANTAPHDIESRTETEQLGGQLVSQLLANN